MSQSFAAVPRLVHGAGAFTELGCVLAACGSRVLLVTGRGALVENGTVAAAEKQLAAAGLVCAAYTGVPPEPPLSSVDAARSAAQDLRADVLLGLGGGSALDVAKAAAGLLKAPEPTAAYFNGLPLDGAGAVPFVAVPTTFGTGTEVTPNAVLTDPAAGVKKSIRHDGLRAAAAIVDPELGRLAPASIKAHAGLDALTQAVECAFSRHATSLTDALAFQAVRLLARHLRAFVLDDDAGAGEACALGSTMAGMAFANARLGMVHGVAHPLGARYHRPHGWLCGVLLPHALQFNRPAVPEKYEQLCHLVGSDLTEAVKGLLAAFALPADLGELGVTAAALPDLVEASLPSGSLKANPRSVDAAQLTEFLAAVCAVPPHPGSTGP